MKKGYKLYIRKVFFIGKLALVFALACVVLWTVMVMQSTAEIFVPDSAGGSENSHPLQVGRSRNTSIGDYSAIFQKNIFCGAADSLKAIQPLPSENTGSPVLPEKETGLALFGTISGNPEIARAIIKDLKTGVLDQYKIGQTAVNARVEAIEQDAVVLLHNGEKRTLRLNGAKFADYAGNQTPAPSSAATNTPPQAAKTDVPVEQPPLEVQTRFRDVTAVLKKAVIEPYVESGQVEGLRITGLENLQMARELGLKNGDVIRAVNGQRLTSKKKAYQVLKKARSQSAIRIELLRDSKIKDLSFLLK